VGGEGRVVQHLVMGVPVVGGGGAAPAAAAAIASPPPAPSAMDPSQQVKGSCSSTRKDDLATFFDCNPDASQWIQDVLFRDENSGGKHRTTTTTITTTSIPCYHPTIPPLLHTIKRYPPPPPSPLNTLSSPQYSLPGNVTPVPSNDSLINFSLPFSRIESFWDHHHLYPLTPCGPPTMPVNYDNTTSTLQ